MVLINQSFHGSMRVCAYTYTQVLTIGGLRERERERVSSSLKFSNWWDFDCPKVGII